MIHEGQEVYYLTPEDLDAAGCLRRIEARQADCQRTGGTTGHVGEGGQRSQTQNQQSEPESGTVNPIASDQAKLKGESGTLNPIPGCNHGESVVRSGFRTQEDSERSGES
jgi:hypothetical protein